MSKENDALHLHRDVVYIILLQRILIKYYSFEVMSGGSPFNFRLKREVFCFIND